MRPPPPLLAYLSQARIHTIPINATRVMKILTFVRQAEGATITTHWCVGEDNAYLVGFCPDTVLVGKTIPGKDSMTDVVAHIRNEATSVYNGMLGSALERREGFVDKNLGAERRILAALKLRQPVS